MPTLYMILDFYCKFTDFGVNFDKLFELNPTEIKEIIGNSNECLNFLFCRKKYLITKIRHVSSIQKTNINMMSFNLNYIL